MENHPQEEDPLARILLQVQTGEITKLGKLVIDKQIGMTDVAMEVAKKEEKGVEVEEEATKAERGKLVMKREEAVVEARKEVIIMKVAIVFVE